MDREPRPRVRQEKGALRRLIRLVESNSEWVLGYEDETWWSRFEQPSLHSWAEAGEPMRLLQKEAKKDDPDPKALSCYGLYLPELERTWLRFVDGRPVSAISTQFLSWSCQKLEELGKKALVLVWDNASWHKSKFVREWIAAHNREVRERGSGVRIVPCFLPKKSPWLNAIEPKWVHGKRNVVEPDLVLTAHELADRVCEVFGCTHEPHLPIPQEVA
jgi:transposase